MQKKIVLLMVLIIIVIGVWLYLFFTSSVKEESKETTPGEKVLPTAPPPERYKFEGIEYEIISVGGPIYDIITGQLTEEQVKILAEKIIKDITAEYPRIKEITLLFYSDLIPAGIGQVDVAEIFWTPEEINVKIIE